MIRESASETALDPGIAQGNSPLSVLRIAGLTARLVAAPIDVAPELHIDEVRVLVPLTFALVAVGAATDNEVLRHPHVCVVPPGQRLRVRVDPGAEAMLVAFDTLACEERAIRVHSRPARIVQARAGVDPALREPLERLAADMRAGVVPHDAEARVADLALHLATDYGTPEAATSCAGLTRARLERVLTLIEERLVESLPVADLAEAVHLSPFHFSRMFRVSTGRSPHEWIMLRRLARAKLLLATTRLPLPEVAKASGYRTHSHFSGMFHAVVGTTPGQYRARHS